MVEHDRWLYGRNNEFRKEAVEYLRYRFTYTHQGMRHLINLHVKKATAYRWCQEAGLHRWKKPSVEYILEQGRKLREQSS